MEAMIQELCTHLGGLNDDASRAAFLSHSPELLEAGIVEQLADEVRRKVRVDVPEALLLAEAAVAIARELGGDETMGRALRAKANALWFMGQCRPATDLFEEAAFRFEKAGDTTEVGRTLSSSIQSLVLLGEYEHALAAGQKAREIFTTFNDLLRLARLDLNIANIYHRQNDFEQAFAAYERAYRQLLPHNDAEGIGVALHNMAVCQIALDNFHGALDTYQKMREFCLASGMPLLAAQADYNIAYLFYLRGDYTRALELLKLSRESCHKNGDQYHLALCDLDESEIYLELRLLDEAAEMAQQSFDRFKALEMNYETGRSLANLAVAAGLQGNSSLSLQLFSQAKETMLREKNRVWPSLLDLYQALVLFDQGDFIEARRLCMAALEFFKSQQLPSKHALCLLLLARICLNNRDLKDALQNCEQAAVLVADLGASVLSYQTHFVTAQVYEVLGQPERAYELYRLSQAELNSIRGTLQTEELKIAFVKDKIEVYARLIKLCLDRDSGPASMEAAFLLMEEAKSRALRDLIFARPLAMHEGSKEYPTDSRTRELRQELNWYYARMEREQLSQEGFSADELDSLRRRALACEHELLRLLRESRAPDLQVRNRAGATAVSLNEIRASLDAETELVEYFCVGDQVMVALLTAGDLKIVPLANLHTLNQQLRMFQFQISKFRLGAAYVASFERSLLEATRGHLQAIYSSIFAPLRRLLSGRHLVIVPYGPLHSLPFHALFDGRRFLIDDFAISYAPSASLYALRHGRDTPSGSALILGIEDARMPFVLTEVQEVAGILPNSKVLIGSAATAQALRDEGASSSLIHIATHGYFRQDSPMFSAIRLSDSYLSLYDLYRMDLPVDLLTLSGCVTGASVIAAGDELLGLARGLLYAGARSLLLSLWDVDDRSTSEFMRLFYSHLVLSGRKAEAFREAVLALRDRYPHPYYWAPFRLLGKSTG